jgi:glycolate oxidase
METLKSALEAIVGAAHVLTGAAITEDYSHDESLAAEPHPPDFVVLPDTTEQVAAVLRLASSHRIPVTARGSGTGLSGACIAADGGIVLSTQRLRRIIEVDTQNHVAVVEAGVTLAELDEATLGVGLRYPIAPGEASASLGGTVATNAGGMHAIKHGVTRHNVLGLQAVLASGEIVRTGAKVVKTASGFDLTQLLIGSEGTLAVVTEVTLKLCPRLPHRATLLVPFDSLDTITRAVPQLVAAGLDPLVLEYIDMLTMTAVLQRTGLELGVPTDIQQRALAYLVVVFEARTAARASEDVEAAGALAVELGALDAYVLPPQAGSDLLQAREQAYWVAKQAGANDIVDVVVPRAAIADYMRSVAELAQRYESAVLGCGHAGDGNVHLAIFQADATRRSQMLSAILSACTALGGVISAEHGIGREKLKYFIALEPPTRLQLMRDIKAAFDPFGILNPGAVLGHFDGAHWSAQRPTEKGERRSALSRG